MQDHNFVVGKYNSSTYYHRAKNLRVMVHAELIVQSLNLEKSKPVTTPGEDLLDVARAVGYMQIAARANYMAQDRADTQFAVKEVCRGMTNPTMGHWRQLKRLGRYLRGRPRAVTNFPFQNRPGQVDGFSDSDWAGCRRTARSTSGGAIMIGHHLLKSWSATQRNITLSSAEAELVAAVRTCSECIGVVQLASDWGVNVSANIFADS